MFDETEGYYDAASGVSLSDPSTSLALGLTQYSGGPTGVPSLTGFSAGRLRGPLWEMGAALTAGVCLPTSLSSTPHQITRRATWLVSKDIILSSVANCLAGLSSLQYKDAVSCARDIE